MASKKRKKKLKKVLHFTEKPIVLKYVNNAAEAYNAFVAVHRFLSEMPNSIGQSNGATVRIRTDETLEEWAFFTVYQTSTKIYAIKQNRKDVDIPTPPEYSELPKAPEDTMDEKVEDGEEKKETGDGES